MGQYYTNEGLVRFMQILKFNIKCVYIYYIYK